jgi:hypothetical protein
MIITFMRVDGKMAVAISGKNCNGVASVAELETLLAVEGLETELAPAEMFYYAQLALLSDVPIIEFPVTLTPRVDDWGSGEVNHMG